MTIAASCTTKITKRTQTVRRGKETISLPVFALASANAMNQVGIYKQTNPRTAAGGPPTLRKEFEISALIYFFNASTRLTSFAACCACAGSFAMASNSRRAGVNNPSSALTAPITRCELPCAARTCSSSRC
jgi:hypothetical protein